MREAMRPPSIAAATNLMSSHMTPIAPPPTVSTRPVRVPARPARRHVRQHAPLRRLALPGDDACRGLERNDNVIEFLLFCFLVFGGSRSESRLLESAS